MIQVNLSINLELLEVYDIVGAQIQIPVIGSQGPFFLVSAPNAHVWAQLSTAGTAKCNKKVCFE